LKFLKAANQSPKTKPLKFFLKEETRQRQELDIFLALPPSPRHKKHLEDNESQRSIFGLTVFLHNSVTTVAPESSDDDDNDDDGSV
jgi:hypothetical protein